ncbi:MAG: hypothetical protein HYT47_02555 [Candidatus Vogelbacteria bacterium]|nr:hypothetical protein [Candidatus Vogelbacteria bacterium]
MSERHLEHKETLRSWLAPKSRKAQRNDFADVHEINDFATINTISRETIGVPTDDAHRLARVLDFLNHFGKHRPARFLGAFRLGKFLENLQIFSTGKLAKLEQLCLNAHNLVVIIFR